MVNYDKITYGFDVDGQKYGIEASLVNWEAISGLAVTSGSTATSGIMTPDQIQSLVDSKVEGEITKVYKLKGTHQATVADGVITNMPQDAKNGDVWNIALPSGVTSATLDGQTITNGDNVVFVEASGEDGSWDKMAGSIDTTVFSTKDWVNDGSEEGSLPMQMISGAYATSAQMVDGEDTSLVSNAGVKDYVGGYIYDNTLKTAEALSGIDESTSGMLVNAGAITDYIYDQIQTTIQETIDVADEITETTPTSAVPNVGAVIGYVEDQLEGANSYGVFNVNDGVYSATKPNDTFTFVNGDGVSLSVGDDGLSFNSNIDISGYAGVSSDASSVQLGVVKEVKEGVVGYTFTIPSATTATVGVTKKAYFDETDGFIHLF